MIGCIAVFVTLWLVISSLLMIHDSASIGIQIGGWTLLVAVVGTWVAVLVWKVIIPVAFAGASVALLIRDLFKKKPAG